MNRQSSAVEYMRLPAMIRHTNSLRSVTDFSHRSVTITPIFSYQSTASLMLLPGTCEMHSQVGGFGTDTLGSSLAIWISPFDRAAAIPDATRLRRPTLVVFRRTPSRSVPNVVARQGIYVRADDLAVRSA